MSIDVATFPKPPAWVDRAACARTGDFGFYPDKNDRGAVKDVIEFCGTCPVQRQCLDYAIANHESWGIWGGRNFSKRISKEAAS